MRSGSGCRTTTSRRSSRTRAATRCAARRSPSTAWSWRDVGVRPSGESSRVPGNQKMSMRIQFDAFDTGKKMGGVDEIKLSGSWDDPFIVPRPAGVLGLSAGDARPARDRRPGLGQRPAARRLRDRGGLGQGGAHVALSGSVRPALPPAGPDQRGSVRVQRRRPGGVRAAALGSGRRSTADPAADVVIGAALQVVAESPTRIGDVFDVDALLTYFAVSAIAVEHRRLHGAVRGRRPLPVLRPGDGTLHHPALGSRQHLRLDQRSARPPTSSSTTSECVITRLIAGPARFRRRSSRSWRT